MPVRVRGEKAAAEIQLDDGLRIGLAESDAGAAQRGGVGFPGFVDEIVAELNARFAGEEFREDQERSWVEALVAAMKADPELREQAEVNSEAQFLSSPSLRDAVTLAVVDTNDAHSRMVDLFHAKNDVEVSVIHLLGKLLYLDVHAAV